MTVVVLSPHLDDAVLSAFSVLTRGEEEDVHVVNVFTGTPEREDSLSLWDKVCGFDDSFDVCRRRIAEDERAHAALGVSRVSCLGLRDHLIRKADGTGKTFTADVVDAISEPVRAARVVYAPLAGGPRPHSDHVLVRDAARILRKLDDIDPLVLYADQPYCYKSRAWPAFILNHGVKDAADAHWDVATDLEGLGWWKRFPRAVPEMVSLDEACEVVRLGESERVRKQRTMAMYETQYENLNTKLRTKGLLRDPDLYGVEVFWTLP